MMKQDIVSNDEPRATTCSRKKHEGFVLWFTGVSGTGKTTVSALVERRLRAVGARVERLDGDVIRTYISKGLGFSKEDRDENVRRIGFIAEILCRNGVIVIVAAISPYRAVRQELQSSIGAFIEIYMHCPLEVLVARDNKGLYKRALAGEIEHFTGISDPYESPLAPDLAIDSSQETPAQSESRVWAKLKDLGYDLIPAMDHPQQEALFKGHRKYQANNGNNELIFPISL